MSSFSSFKNILILSAFNIIQLKVKMESNRTLFRKFKTLMLKATFKFKIIPKTFFS